MKSKRINLILLMIITSFMLINTSYAAEETNEQCETYTNYYFFFNVLREELYNTNIQITPAWKITNQTTFSQLYNLTNKQNIKNIKNSNVCIVRNENDTCNEDFFEKETITVNDFWTKYIETLKKHTKEDYNIDEYENTSAYILKEGNKKYIIHQKYKKIEGEDNDTTVYESDPTKYNFTESDIPKLINASALPSELSVQAIITEMKKPFKITITRYLTKEPYNTNLEPFGLKYDTAENPETHYFSPAMHKITYDVCNEPYNATITYVNKENGEEIAKPYNEKKYPGEGDEVKSPDIKDCTPSTTTVSYKIDETNPSDFNKVVTYSCIKDNPKTGSIFVGGIVIITIISLVSIIYFTKRNKTNEI